MSPIYVWECDECGEMDVYRSYADYKVPPDHPHPVRRVLSACMAIADIEPYVARTGDKAGKIIGSRKEHKAFLKRNKLVEFGNEMPKPKPMRKTAQKREIIEAMRDVGVSDIIRRGSR
jgi:hypothetical protein